MHKSTMLVLSTVLVVTLGTTLGCLAQAQNAAPAISANSQPANTPLPQPPPGVQDNAGTGSNNGAVGSGGEVPANTELRATLDTPLSTKTSKPGDRFTATVSQPVSGGVGVVVPVGSRVEGEVSETDQTKSATVLHGKETLNLRFRDIVLPNGQTVPLVSSLVSVNSTNGKTTQRAENQVESGSRGKTVTTDSGLDSGAGVPASPSFGGPLKGLAIGNLSGGGYVLATTSKQQVTLPAQTGMVIRLDQPLKVE
jgi:hypothetical protein